MKPFVLANLKLSFANIELDIIYMLPTQAALLQVQNSGPSQMPIHEMPKTLQIAKTFTKQHKLRKVLVKVCIVKVIICVLE